MSVRSESGRGAGKVMSRSASAHEEEMVVTGKAGLNIWVEYGCFCVYWFR